MNFEPELRDLAWVPRWAIIRTTRTQSVAEHSYFTALYADQIATSLKWNGPRDQLIRYALLHDLEEILSGDIASPAKRSMKAAAGENWKHHEGWEINKLQERFGTLWQPDEKWMVDIQDIMRVADLLEAAFFLSDEKNLGNRNVLGVSNDILLHLRKAYAKLSHNPFVDPTLMNKMIQKIDTNLTSMAISRVVS